MTRLTLQPIRVRTGSGDAEGRLALLADELVAVLVRLEDAVHGADQGKWFLEAGFGPLAFTSPHPFADLDKARAWIEESLLPRSDTQTAWPRSPAGDTSRDP